MAELWITDEPITGRLDENRSLTIPESETLEVAYRDDAKDAVRVFWDGSKEGLGGLMVSAADLERCAHKV